MTDEKKKMTAQGSSVGADDGQSISQITENSIPTSGQKSNDKIVNSQDSLEEMCQRMQRLIDPRYLHYPDRIFPDKLYQQVDHH
jgi:hypothetical protein